MSEISNANKGIELVDKKEYEQGIELLTKALKVRESPLWLLSRSKAYQNTKQLERALADAELAYLLASERQGDKSQAQRAEAQYRRAVVYFRMGLHADSDACCIWSMQVLEGRKFSSEADDVAKNVDADGNYRGTVENANNRKSKFAEKGDASNASQANEGRSDWARAYVWRNQALTALQALPEINPGRKLGAKRIPARPVFKDGVLAETVAGTVTQSKTKPAEAAGSSLKAASSAPKPKVRVDFYQTDKTVNLTLYIRGVVKDLLKVHTSETTITIKGLPESDKNDDSIVLELAGLVKTSNPIAPRITPYKLEFTLEKAEVGVKWGSWGSQLHQGSAAEFADFDELKKQYTAVGATAGSAGRRSAENDKPAAGVEEKKPTGPPAYPTSAKGGPRDWEKLESGVDDEDGADANGFFKQIFASSTPDQQRAMMKSFTESNGTTLSTDWADVGSRKVETLPPDGVEAKKW